MITIATPGFAGPPISYSLQQFNTPDCRGQGESGRSGSFVLAGRGREKSKRLARARCGKGWRRDGRRLQLGHFLSTLLNRPNRNGHDTTATTNDEWHSA